jgi:hypothetical protein
MIKRAWRSSLFAGPTRPLNPKFSSPRKPLIAATNPELVPPERAFYVLAGQVSKARAVYRIRELLSSPLEFPHAGHLPCLLPDNASYFTTNMILITGSQISLHTPSFTKARNTQPANTSSSLSKSAFFFLLSSTGVTLMTLVVPKPSSQSGGAYTNVL